jgi:copper(I)-binding protein
VIRSSRRGTGAPRGGRALLAAAGLAAALTACSAGQEAQTAFISPNVEGANGDVGDIALRNITIAYPDGGRYAKAADARLQFTLVNSGDGDDALVEVRTDAAERVTFGTGQQAGGSATASGTASGSSPAAGSATPSPTGSATPSPTGTPSSTGTPVPPATPTSSGSAGSGSPTGSASASPTPSPAAPSGTAGRIEVPAGTYVACRDSGPVVTLVGLTSPLLPAETVQITFVFQNAGEIDVEVPVAVPLTEVSPPPTIDVQATEGGG